VRDACLLSETEACLIATEKKSNGLFDELGMVGVQPILNHGFEVRYLCQELLSFEPGDLAAAIICPNVSLRPAKLEIIRQFTIFWTHDIWKNEEGHPVMASATRLMTGAIERDRSQRKRSIVCDKETSIRGEASNRSIFQIPLCNSEHLSDFFLACLMWSQTSLRL
jgi:hypothetical protein